MASVSPMAEVPAKQGLEKVVCPPTRHISVPVPDIVESLMANLAPDLVTPFAALAKLLEATCQFEYLEIRNRLKKDFLPFSAGASRQPLPLEVSKEPPSDEVLDREELEFVAGFDALMDAAHYNRLSKQEWATAEQEEFTFMMPVEVDWSKNDTSLLSRFWEAHPSERDQAAEIADRILVFHRGIDKATASGLYIVEKIDLLVAYLIAVPIAKRLAQFFPENALLQALQKVGDGLDARENEQMADDPILNHKHAKVIYRSSLERQMPNTGAVFNKLFKTIELSEPMFQSVVVLYRNKVPEPLIPLPPSLAKDKKGDPDKPPQSPASEFQKQLERRNIMIRRYEDIPMADTEMIFPDKKIYIKPITIIQLIFTVLGGLVAALATLWNEKSSWQVMGSVIVLLLGRAYQVYYSANVQKQRISDDMTKAVYDRTRGSQESVLYLLLEEMTDQHIKEVLLAYVTLLQSGSGMTEAQLDERCEAWLESRFGVGIDFAIAQSLVCLIEDGIVRKDAQGILTATPLEEAVKILDRKWHAYFKSSDPWPVKNARLARITDRRSNDIIPAHKVDKKVLESLFEDGPGGELSPAASGEVVQRSLESGGASAVKESPTAAGYTPAISPIKLSTGGSGSGNSSGTGALQGAEATSPGGSPASPGAKAKKRFSTMLRQVGNTLSPKDH